MRSDRKYRNRDGIRPGALRLIPLHDDLIRRRDWCVVESDNDCTGRQGIRSLQGPQENVVCSHFGRRAINTAVDAVAVRTGRRVCSTRSRVGPDAIGDVTGKRHGIMTEQGCAARLHAVDIKTGNAEHADRQNNECD